MHTNPGTSFLSINRDATHTRNRIRTEMEGGAKTLHGIAHRSWLSVEQAAAELRGMMTDGWFKIVTTADGRNLVLPAEPGEQLIDPDLYADILSAVRAGAATVAEVAEWLDIPCDDTLTVAVGVSLRIAGRGNG